MLYAEELMCGAIGGLEALVLSRILGDFPIAEDPYSEIGRPLGISAAEVLSIVRGLVERGVVRKVGPFFNPWKMGHVSTLCALDVPGEAVKEAASLINSYPEVTRNCLRDGSPNLWFTVMAESKTAMGKVIAEIETKAMRGPVRAIPAIMMFRVKAGVK
ncbi:MAG: Lrp/AsnC family transcriptional regulator [Deltaproteobacteria bacterium]|nr:Lrp/AsnC family transcriptional regulator [Deltaproteobacteria bacterium]